MENIFNYKIIEDGDMSGNLDSSIVDLSITNGYAIQAIWTGTPTGSLRIQVSNDGIQWTDYNDSIVSLSGSAGSTVWLEPNAMYDKVRVIYTSVSGGGTLNVQINGKGDRGV